ncbi:MAG: site-specific integrase [Parvibaculum sp.]|uniref:tyrosine-type recombinase/integrase n=1 Tax=Parvibaculum sp. TaxID=2024848 RepID=UPI0027306FC6|nr:site-specific integrase [Parvibaculum sp.]MDP2150042.1 site-specific integrase [Parvibaculum sp.]
MSVYIRSDSKDGTYSYDFELGGRRFSGGTGKTSRREALQVERAKRAEADREVAAESALYAPRLTLKQACARYWHEAGQHLENADSRFWSLEWLMDFFGEATPFETIGDAEVARMVAKRRGEFIPRRKAKVLVANATVNRTVTEPLRDIRQRALKVWKVKVGDVDWSLHMLDEPEERVREASAGEERAVAAELAEGYRDALDFAFLTGCRRMEIVGLVWARVDFFGRQFTVIGKGGKLRVIPMSQAVFDLLWALRGHHATSVFTYVAARTLKKRGLVRGRRYPLTKSGLKSAARRAIARAAVTNFRFHDTRHTAATRILRQSNLRVVQLLLGHADPSTTAKYAHALQDDIRAAMDAARPTEIATDEMKGIARALSEKGKRG